VARSLGTGGRFAVAYLALGLFVGAGLGAFVVLEQRPAPKPPPPWSAWRPTTVSTGQTAQAIASHVAGSYHLPGGGQLARAVLDPPESAAASVQFIALANSASSGVRLADPSSTVLYTLCGTAANCKVEGSASIARGDVLRREVLELALYTFEYSKVADVGVFFPPEPGEKSSNNVFFFARNDLKPELNHPLRATLPHAKPPLPGKLSTRELQTIDDLTGGHRFRFGVETARSGARVLVLRPAA
jgi:hypothetical protein